VRSWLLLGLVLGMSLICATGARAGTYDVYGCRLPDGTRIATRGWTSLGWGGSAVDQCRAGGSLSAYLDSTATLDQGTRLGWEFDAPPDTDIAGYTLFRSSAVVGGGYQNRVSFIYHDAPVYDGASMRYTQVLCMQYVMACAGWGDSRYPMAPTNRYERAGLQIRRLILTSECYVTDRSVPQVCPPVAAPNQAYVSVHSSRVSVQDSTPPAFVSAPSGALFDSAPIEGSRVVTFAAEDRGGGLATASVIVDGRIVGEQPADPNAADCHQPYLAPVPCPLTAIGSIELDTTSIANGPHQLSLALTDAGGNRTESTPVTVTVRNPGAANGAHASRFARLEAWFETRSSRHRTSATVRYGRTRAIVGRLIDEAGAPISDATLDIAATAARPGATTRALGQVATDADGAFRYLPRSGSSRHLVIGYRAFHLDEAPAALATVGLNVRAGVVLSVRPRRVSAHGRIKIDGRHRGGPGREGTQVVLYAVGARTRDRIPVTTVRANAKGQFHYRYRFRASAPGTVYRFQARLHSQANYPYASGDSLPVTVRIR
jgi:hypothetical protein